MFAHQHVDVRVGVAVTDRRGGVSTGPWASLNLADHVGDEPAAVEENRERVRRTLDVVALVTMRQVHGHDVAVVDGVGGAPPTADALVTRTPGLALVALVADCTPVLLADEEAAVVGAVHAGRRGLAAGVIPAAVEAMIGLGARPDRLTAVVGPAICAEHYEVPAAMRAEVAAVAPDASAMTSRQTPALDIRAGLVAQLRAAGVGSWSTLPQCTFETPDCYSFRRDGVTGRFAGVVWIRP